MRDLRKAFTEDLRRFGLVLVGAGVLSNGSAVATILSFAVGLMLLSISYIILAATKDEP